MELVLTENGIQQKSNPKLTELGKQEVLQNSLKRIGQPLCLVTSETDVRGGKVEKPQLCKHCLYREVNEANSYCSTCIPIVAEICRKNDEKERQKNLEILFGVILIIGFFLVVIISRLAA